MEGKIVRNTFAFRLKDNQRQNYGQILRENWALITMEFDANEVTNFSIWNISDLFFGYCESVSEPAKWPDETKSFFSEMMGKFEEYIEWISIPWQPMRLMYQDYGIVRQSKELIRHRVFITRLKSGCGEEYKRRHDALINARTGINTGPDSNFTIWYAGGYIFGYDEIDVTMEKDKTDAERDAEIAWESKMLEIMNWVTDDMDWLTGEHNSHIRQICHHL